MERKPLARYTRRIDQIAKENSLICENYFKNICDFQVFFIKKRGRFSEEENVEINVKKNEQTTRLLVLKLFSGRAPYYRKWIEVFMISKNIVLDNIVLKFADSLFEKKLIECLSNILNSGEWLFIEYLYDDETRLQLEAGTPPVLTRLGYLLFTHGFTWFKDWYYPEGFMEGLPKLQAEKPLNEETRDKHLIDICQAVFDYMHEAVINEKYSWIIERTVERANNIINLCREENYLATENRPV